MTRVVKGFCVFVVVLMGVSFLTAAEETVSLQSVCSDMGIHIPGSERFVVMKDIRRAGADGSFRTIVATDRESTVRMECIQSIEPSRATEYIEERKYVLEALYQRIPSPYPGMITDTIECAPEFKPEKASVHHGKGIEEVYVLSSTARFTYGACADDLVQYKGGMGFLYCPGRRLLCTLEIFYPKQRFERETLLAFFASVSCSSNVAPEAPLNIIIIGLEPLGTRYMSLYGFGWSAAYGIGPLLGGILNDNLGPKFIWYGGGFAGVLGVLIFVLLAWRYPLHKENKTA